MEPHLGVRRERGRPGVASSFNQTSSRRGAGRSRSTGRVSVTRTTSWRSLSLASVYVPMIDMYPRRIGIYISRLAGGSATPLALGADVRRDRGPVAGLRRWTGHARILRDPAVPHVPPDPFDLTFTAVDQTEIAAQLVLYARGENTWAAPPTQTRRWGFGCSALRTRLWARIVTGPTSRTSGPRSGG